MRLAPGSPRSRRFSKGSFWATPQLPVANVSATRSLWEASVQIPLPAGTGNLASLGSASRVLRPAPRLAFIIV